jgi:alpha-galactosidase
MIMFKNIILTILVALSLLVGRSTASVFAETLESADVVLKEKNFEVPFSFVYDGRSSSDFLPEWKRQQRGVSEPDNNTEHNEVVYVDTKTGLSVKAEIIIYHEFSAVEWVLFFTNTGSSDTPIIENIQVLDTTLNCDVNDECVLHYANGAAIGKSGFAPKKDNLTPKITLRYKPGGGKSSGDILPFFNVDRGHNGIIYAIGWTGEWAAKFSRNEKGLLQIQAGMDLTHLKLHPGETIRTPRILQLNWQQSRIEGHNMLRRLILAHYRPIQGGKPIEIPRLLFNSWGADSLSTHFKNIREIKEFNLPFEYYWIDAQWHGSGKDWAKNVGNWNHCKDNYPVGLRPISDLLHKDGRKFLLWFEPERVAKDTPWYKDHQNFLLHRSPDQPDNLLFNLGDPNALKFLIDYISNKITEYGIDCYRQDFNFPPLGYWRDNDAPDRQGITEIRHIEGLYAFWDELLRRHPNLIIDNCASGGMRIDLETICRATCFWRSDSGFFSPIETQCQSYGLNLWVPLQGAGQPNRAMCEDNYAWRSMMTPAINIAADLSGDLSNIKKNFAQYLSIHKYFYGDYYPLAEYSEAEDAWMAYQLNRPDMDEGVLVVLKRPKSFCTDAAFPLSGLKDQANYKVTNLDTHQSWILPGRQLRTQGVVVELLNKPDSALFVYSIVQNEKK